MSEVTEMSEERLTFNDGTVLENTTAIQDGDSLYLYMNDDNVTMHDAFLLLEDAEKTQTIVGHQYGIDTEYVGYTDLTSIRKERRIKFSAALKRAE